MTFNSVITLSNSIIGVAILAMPFCFEQCGIGLAGLILISCSLIIRFSCHLLIKSASMSRRRTYEMLAMESYGLLGKLCVEVFMVGYLFGTCVAFFVVIGDLATPLVANFFSIQQTLNLRTFTMIFFGVFIALPLALLRKVDSLASICTASIGFYISFLVYVCLMSVLSILSSISSYEDLWSKYEFWRPDGVFRSLPIFSMALTCQPQLFEVYRSLPHASVTAMNNVVYGAITLCSACYLLIGIFGYTLFAHQKLDGNVLTSFEPSMLVHIMQFGFVLSVAVGFPLLVFPCRTSLNFLLFRKSHTTVQSMPLIESGLTGNAATSQHPYLEISIPQNRFVMLTVVIFVSTLALGIVLPDIEFVLGMIGSTIGCAVCLVFPALIFIKLKSNTEFSDTEKVHNLEWFGARFLLTFGLLMMVIGSYSHIYDASKSSIIQFDEKFDLSNQKMVADEGVLLSDVDSNIKREPVVFQEFDSSAVVQDSDPLKPLLITSTTSSTKNTNVDTSEKEKQTLMDSKKAELESIEKILKDKEKIADKLVMKLEKQNDEQKVILQEQKEILKEMEKKMDQSNRDPTTKNVLESSNVSTSNPYEVISETEISTVEDRLKTDSLKHITKSEVSVPPQNMTIGAFRNSESQASLEINNLLVANSKTRNFSESNRNLEPPSNQVSFKVPVRLESTEEVKQHEVVKKVNNQNVTFEQDFKMPPKKENSLLDKDIPMKYKKNLDLVLADVDAL